MGDSAEIMDASLLSQGFVLDQYEDIVKLLEKYGVEMHFSGHSHILQDKAAECFDQATRCQVQAELAYLSLAPEVEKDMTEFAVEINRQYFATTLSDDDREKRMQSQRWKLWKEKGKDTFWYVYLNSILNE